MKVNNALLLPQKKDKKMLIETTKKFKARFDELTDLIIKPEIIADNSNWKKLVKERSALEEIAEAHDAYEKALADTAAEQEELARVKQEVANFKARLMSIYREHLTMIGILEGADEEAKPVKEEEPAVVAAAPAAEKPEAEKPAVSYREVPDISAFTLDDEE